MTLPPMDRPSFLARFTAFVAVALLAAAGCVPFFHAAPSKPTDANIAAILLAANNADISYAELVPTRSDRSDVKTFAQRMQTDHAGVNRLVDTLLKQISLTPEDNLASLDIRDDAATKRAIMHELAGA